QVLDDDEGDAAVLRHVLEKLLEGLEPAGRRADADDRKPRGDGRARPLLVLRVRRCGRRGLRRGGDRVPARRARLRRRGTRRRARRGGALPAAAGLALGASLGVLATRHDDAPREVWEPPSRRRSFAPWTARDNLPDAPWPIRCWPGAGAPRGTLAV